MPDDDVLTQVELALSIVRRVERECRVAKTTLARLRDELSQSKEDTENNVSTVGTDTAP